MTAVWFNEWTIDDDERRRRLYDGDIFVYDRVPSVVDFVSFTRQMIDAAVAPHDPEHVHEALSPVELAPILGRLKPSFIHHPDARRLMVAILEEFGTDVMDCHIDVPKLRTAYPIGHLTKGIAYAFPAHRDTWYGAPQAQINYWMPVYSLQPDNAMAFYPRYFSRCAENDSQRFNYYRRNIERKDVTKFITEDPRIQPSAVALPKDEPTIRLLPQVGGLIMFSGAQLHATVTTPTCLSRYSIDFRTVSRRDVEQDFGAPNVDARCTGTALRDFKCAHDGTTMPEELARRLDPIGPRQDEAAEFEFPSALLDKNS
jgi:hypothetical protein